MCIITDENHIILSISLIRGLGQYPATWHIYEYMEMPKEKVGEYYNPEEKMTLTPTTPESYDGAKTEAITKEEWLNIPNLQKPSGQKSVLETLGPLPPALCKAIENQSNQVKK